MTEKCPACGKEFYVLYPNQWAYKWKQQHVCTWGCLRKLQRQDEPERGEIEMDGTIVKINLEQRMKAANIAISGENPYPYLESLGCANPTAVWYSIKKMIRKNYPELYKKLPKRVGMSPVESGKKARAVALAKAEEKKEKIRLIYDETERKAYEEQQATEAAHEEPKTAAEAMENMKDAADSFFGTYCPEEPAEAQETNETEEPELEYKTMGIQAEMGIFQYYKRTGYLDWTPNDPGADTVSLYVEEWRQLINDLPKIARILGVEL